MTVTTIRSIVVSYRKKICNQIQDEEEEEESSLLASNFFVCGPIFLKFWQTKFRRGTISQKKKILKIFLLGVHNPLLCQKWKGGWGRGGQGIPRDFFLPPELLKLDPYLSSKACLNVWWPFLHLVTWRRAWNQLASIFVSLDAHSGPLQTAEA